MGIKLKIFWKKDCPLCPNAKNIGKMVEDKIEVQYCNIDSVEGLSEACMLNVLSTPTIVMLDNNNKEIEAWRGIIPELDEIKEKISD